MEYFGRYCRVQIIYADIPDLISQISLSGIALEDIEPIDLLTVNARVQYRFYKQLRELISKAGGSSKVIEREGKLWKTATIWKRPVIFLGLLLHFAAIVIIPNRIFIFEVKGNNSVSEQCVLTNAEKVGFKFGVLASEIRSEELKNKLLESLPQLQWVGITTKGCVAQIHVKERSVANTEDQTSKIVTHIVSACDGIITDQTVLEGSPIFRAGDAVKKGDILVSGYMDCGIKFRIGQADADVFALTMRQNQFYSMNPVVQRGVAGGVQTCYKLRIGKKVINLCNHSGIMDVGCVKMYLEDYLTLPGGFYLPVSIIKIIYTDYETLQSTADETVFHWLPLFARKYLKSQMVSGEILGEDLQWEENDAMQIMTGSYACHEMIGREKYEGIME